MADIKLEINTDKVLNALDEQTEVVLTAWGMQAEDYAVKLSQVDTGRQKNSITFALHGQAANKRTYKADKPNKQGEIVTGSYSGVAPDEANTVYIGTNVPYAEINEFRGAFLRPAIIDHRDDYQRIVENILKK